jgi:Protein of unknown function (DUF742)
MTLPRRESARHRGWEPTERTDEDEVWADEEAGPVVRAYAVTSGRTRPAHGRFDLVTQVSATRPVSPADDELPPEDAAIIRSCQNPVSVAELAARLNLPLGTVRVLLGDLLDRGLVQTRAPGPDQTMPAEPVFKAVLDGLRAL